jgi:hypothetical protein
MGIILVLLFIGLIAFGVPIAYTLGIVSFVGIASLDTIPNMVVFTKMFNGLKANPAAVPLFILSANLMNQALHPKLIDVCMH